MSTQFIAFAVMILATLFPTISNDALMTTISTLVALGAGVYGMYRRWKQGGITAFGKRI